MNELIFPLNNFIDIDSSKCYKINYELSCKKIIDISTDFGRTEKDNMHFLGILIEDNFDVKKWLIFHTWNATEWFNFDNERLFPNDYNTIYKQYNIIKNSTITDFTIYRNKTLITIIDTEKKYHTLYTTEKNQNREKFNTWENLNQYDAWCLMDYTC